MTSSTPETTTPPVSPDKALPFKQALPWAAFITLLYLFNYMSRATLSPLLVHVEQGLGIGHAAAGSLLLMQSIGMSVTLAGSGFLLSVMRPRMVVAASVGFSGLVLLGMFFVDSLLKAQLLFLLFGLVSGVYFPSGMAVLATLVYPRDWGKTVAIHELAPNLGFILIPLLAQLGLLFTNWQGVFAGMGTIMIVLAVCFAIWGRGGSQTTLSPSFKECGLLLRNPASWIATLLLCVTMIGEFSIFSILQLFLVNDVQFSPEKANLFLSLSRGAAPLVVLIGGIAADRYNAANAVRGCLAAHMAALLLMSLNPQTYYLAVMCGTFLQPLSIAFVFPSIFKLFAAAFPQDEQPLLYSVSLPVAMLASAGAAPFFLGFCGQYLSFAAGFFTLAVLSGLTIFSVKLVRKRP